MESSSLLDALSASYPDSSKTTLRNWIANGRVEVDGQLATRANTVVTANQKISVGPRPKMVDEDLKILFEDRDLVVIDKPPGLLSVAADVELEKSAHSLLKRRFHRPRVYPVHRLDRETSGVLVFAYSDAARDGLKAQFEEHSIQREYRALVYGTLPDEKGTIQSYLTEDVRLFVHSTDAEHGKLAITHYEVLEKRKEQTFLRLILETGRKNQIRVHLSEAGFPIVGDRKYGIEGEKAPRLYLHALHLGFTHPTTQKKMSFHSPCPF